MTQVTGRHNQQLVISTLNSSFWYLEQSTHTGICNKNSHRRLEFGHKDAIRVNFIPVCERLTPTWSTFSKGWALVNMAMNLQVP
jgi:hypothetical protein